LLLYLLDMNLQQLSYLVSTADTGSLSAAARAHHVSQPVVSRALHSLERECKVALFRRDGRRLALTEAGAAVVESARRAIEAVDEVQRTASRSQLGSELVVVATPTNSALLGPIVASYMKRRPAIALHLRRAGEMADVFRMVAAQEADLGFGELGAQRLDDSMVSEAIWAVDVVLVSPSGGDLPNVVPVAELADMQLVLPPDGSERRRMIDDLITEAGGRRPSAALATDERSAWISSAQHGIGSYLSYKAVADDYEDVELHPFDPPISAHVGFIRRADRLSNEGLELIRLAQECSPPAGCVPVS
jgi:LysR family transcriptional regulator, cyn operon transcriptional activator